MEQQHWCYDMLKHMAINDKSSQDHLEELKDFFRDEIATIRKESRIKTVDDLIECLERHDVLSEENIEPLREIADKFGDKSLQDGVSTYMRPKSAAAYDMPYNQYKEIRLAEDLKNNLSINGQRCKNHTMNVEHVCNCHHHGTGGAGASQPPPPVKPPVATPYVQVFTDKKRATIFKLIAEDIGRSWRALGRELHIKQGRMDQIEMEYPRDHVSRVHKLLQVFEEDETHDPKRIVLTLCRALEECRRKDLRYKVEEIMSH